MGGASARTSDAYRHPGLGSDEGRPAGRADRSAHGFLSCGHRAIGRSPDYAPPFSAGGTTMSFDRGRVERQRDGIFAKLGQRFKDCAPSSALGPTVEAIVDGRVAALVPKNERTNIDHLAVSRLQVTLGTTFSTSYSTASSKCFQMSRSAAPTACRISSTDRTPFTSRRNFTHDSKF